MKTYYVILGVILLMSFSIKGAFGKKPLDPEGIFSNPLGIRLGDKKESQLPIGEKKDLLEKLKTINPEQLINQGLPTKIYSYKIVIPKEKREELLSYFSRKGDDKDKVEATIKAKIFEEMKKPYDEVDPIYKEIYLQWLVGESTTGGLSDYERVKDKNNMKYYINQAYQSLDKAYQTESMYQQGIRTEWYSGIEVSIPDEWKEGQDLEIKIKNRYAKEAIEEMPEEEEQSLESLEDLMSYKLVSHEEIEVGLDITFEPDKSPKGELGPIVMGEAVETQTEIKMKCSYVIESYLPEEIEKEDTAEEKAEKRWEYVIYNYKKQVEQTQCQEIQEVYNELYKTININLTLKGLEKDTFGKMIEIYLGQSVGTSNGTDNSTDQNGTNNIVTKNLLEIIKSIPENNLIKKGNLVEVTRYSIIIPSSYRNLVNYFSKTEQEKSAQIQEIKSFLFEEMKKLNNEVIPLFKEIHKEWLIGNDRGVPTGNLNTYQEIQKAERNQFYVNQAYQALKLTDQTETNYQEGIKREWDSGIKILIPTSWTEGQNLEIIIENTSAGEVYNNIPKMAKQEVVTLEDYKNYKLVDHADIDHGLHIIVSPPEETWIDIASLASTNEKISYKRLVKFGLVPARVSCIPQFNGYIFPLILSTDSEEEQSKKRWEKAVFKAESAYVKSNLCRSFLKGYAKLASEGLFNFTGATENTFGKKVNDYISQSINVAKMIHFEIKMGSTEYLNEEIVGSDLIKADQVFYASEKEDKTRFLFMFARQGSPNSILNRFLRRLELETQESQLLGFTAFSSAQGFYNQLVGETITKALIATSYTVFEGAAPKLTDAAIDIKMKAFHIKNRILLKVMSATRDQDAFTLFKEMILLGRNLNQTTPLEGSPTEEEIKFLQFIDMIEATGRKNDTLLKDADGVGLPQDLSKLKYVNTKSHEADAQKTLDQLGIVAGDTIINIEYLPKSDGQGNILGITKPVE